MKKIVNNRIFKFVLITIILLAIFSTIYYIDLSRFKSKLVKYDDKYLMKITYLIADRDKLDDNASFDSTTNTDDIDYVLYNASQEVPMIKKGDYLYVDLSNFTNKLLLSHVTDTVFAMNNLNGEVIDGCSYDKDTKTIKVPYSYYKEIDKNNPVIVQAGIEILLTREEIRNIEISYSVKKLITHQEKTYNDLMAFQTEIPLSKYVNSNLSKDNLHIYVNNSKAELDEKSFNYDNKTEVLSISMPSILINNVDIRIGNNIIKNVFAVSSSNIPLANSYKLKEKPTRLIDDWNNGEGWYTTPGYSYEDGLASDELFYCGDNTTNIDFQGRPLCWNYTSGGRSANANTFSYDRSYYYDYDEGTYYKANTNRVYPYMVHADMLARQWSWGVGDENVWLKFDDPNSYIILECIHPGERAIGGSSVYSEEPIFVRLRVSVDVDSDLSQNFLILKVVTYAYNRYRDDYTIGGWGTQAGVAFIKVYWEDNSSCNLNIKKNVSTTFTNSGNGTSTITLYGTNDCTGTGTSKTVNVGLANGSSGTVTFENLTPGTTYSFKETGFTAGDFTQDNACYTVTPTDENGDGTCDETPSITNTQNQYCYSIKKVDYENSNTPVAGAVFVLSNGSTSYSATTNASGVATFTGLKYQDYTLSEQSAPSPYWNDNSGGVSVPATNLTAGSTCNVSSTKKDRKQYYCLKVIKKDYSTGNAIAGAEFSLSNGSITIDKNSSDYSSSNGVTSFFLGTNSGNYTATETKAPSGYAGDSSKTVAAIMMQRYESISAARTACLNSDQSVAKASDGNTIASKTYESNSGNNNYVFKDKKYVINWYKTVDGNTLASGAKFKVKNSSGNYLTVNSAVSTTDASGATRTCYVYSGANNTGTVMTSGVNASMNGQVCISGLPSGTYTVEEQDSPEYHTFGSSKTLSITTSNSFSGMTNNNKLVNYKTEFEFTKTVSSGDGDYASLTTSELKKLSFNVTTTSGTVLSFIQTSEGVYEYSGNTVDGTSGTAVTNLKLDSNRKIKLYHLPKGTYYIKELKSCCDSSCSSCSGSTECSGYYYPAYNQASDYSFTITNCSSPSATACSTSGKATKSLSNTPTSITFTKSDIYSYANPTMAVKFEGIDEVNAFDKITFNLKDENGNAIKLLPIGNTGNCKNTSSYSEYRYVADESLLTQAQKNSLTTNINTCGGKIKVTHLCRGKKYTIEETAVPDNTVFTLPDTHPSKDYLIAFTEDGKMCCDTSVNSSVNTTAVISDYPTRIILSKKNGRTNEDIHEATQRKQTAKFEVYACLPTVTRCTYENSLKHKIKFSPLDTNSDNEKVYKALLDQSGTGTTELQLTTVGSKGVIVLEYLPANYKYVVVETNGPDGYYNVSGAIAETEIEYIPKNTTNAVGNSKNIIEQSTMLKFTKSDMYGYYTGSNNAGATLTDKIFDTMTFVLRDKDGNIVSLTKEAPGEYRFIQNDGTYSGNNVQNLHTYGGELIITNLYRGEKYYIEETKADTEGNFILPKNVPAPSNKPSGWTWKGHPYVVYEFPSEVNQNVNGGILPSQSVTQLILNLPTRVVFQKRDTKTGDLIDDSKITSSAYSNRKTTFNVYRCPKTVEHCRATSTGAELVYFTAREYINDLTSDISAISQPIYVYKYSKLNANTGITDLVTDRGMLVLAYLPSEYSYSLYEKIAPNGYYQPSSLEAYTDFTVYSESTDDGDNYVEFSSRIGNKPTSISLAKRDLYNRIDVTSKVSFEDNDATNAFDRITYRLKDKNNSYVRLLPVGNTGNCKTDDSFAEYKYIVDESILTTEQASSLTYDLHTCGGNLKITYLHRGDNYTIEEYSIPSDSVFVLPTNHITKEYLLPYTSDGLAQNNGDIPITSQTIYDNPARIKIYKKNVLTGSDIHEGTTKKQTATFEVYACNSTVSKCTYENSTKTKIKFGNAVVNGTETVYPALVDQTKSGSTSLTLVTKGSTGVLVLDYLPTNYKYVIVETNGPDGYYNVEGSLAETEIEYVPNSTVDATDNEKNIYNNPTRIKFVKTDLYSFYNKNDIASVGIEDKIFDTMTFVLRDENGNIVSLSMDAPGEYRFIQDDGTYSGNTVQNLHTYGGELIISNLYRGEKYYIEETKTDTEGNFILPKNVPAPNDKPSGWTWKGHPYVTYNISTLLPNGTQNGTVVPESVTKVINNMPTRVVFEKRDKTTDELINDSTTTFNVYRCPKTVEHCRANTTGAELVSFESREYINGLTDDITSVTNPIYVYKYSKLNTNSITDLHTDRGMLVLAYLPSEYSYSLYEKTAPNGYYQPSNIEAYTDFTVLSETLDDGSNYVELTFKIVNTPTEINFIKSDLYDYYDGEDLADFREERIKIFDSMTFILRDGQGNILGVKCSKDGEFISRKNTESKCDTGEYRYIPIDENNTLVNLHTNKGKLKITHLYRGQVYYIEEITTDSEGNFILPDYLQRDLNYGDQLPFDNNGHPVVKYILPNEDENNPASITAEIKNTPSRVIFEKRDSKYNYLIPDETATFKVYQCEVNTDCHPADYSTDEERLAAGIKLMNFERRGTIRGDQEDDGIEVYKYKKLNAEGVTELHPDHGKLVLRYLPSDSNYKYVLLEVVAPVNYKLPKGRDAETEFTIVNTTVSVEEISVPNKPTAIIIRKYADIDKDSVADAGELLGGAKFKVYRVTNYNDNKKVKDQDKELLSFKTIKDGVYENRPVKDTEIITTCSGDNCSYDPNTLGYNTEDFDNLDDLINSSDVNVTSVLKEGTAIVQYLEYNTYYVIEEVEAPKGYSLPEDDDNRFTLIHISENEVEILDTADALVNKPTSFTFYKFDEYNSPLDGAVFYLQKLNDDKIYETLSLTKEVLENGNTIYKADPNSTLREITTEGGNATVYYLETGQYRIIEVQAPEGYELPKKTINVATFFVSEDGRTYGNNIIANKKPSETIEYLASAKAELIVNIQTGKKVIKYGLIITVLVTLIAGLIIFMRKRK